MAETQWEIVWKDEEHEQVNKDLGSMLKHTKKSKANCKEG